MLEKTSPIDVRASASTVVEAIKDLHGYLSDAMNPDRIALGDLGMEPMGWTKLAYSLKALEIWHKKLDQFPKDYFTLHHLAIMHHARAFDLESGASPGDSDEDWRKATEYWSRLLDIDEFWDKLAEKACFGTARRDAVSNLRSALPRKLMAIHYDIALDGETRHRRKARAKFHIGMVHDAPFAEREKRGAQEDAYARFMESVPDEVWQPSELREETLAIGQSAIKEFLDFDPRCRPALEDALRLQRRVQRSRNTAWRAMDENDPERKKLLLKEKKDAEEWRPFFDQLLAMVDELEDAVRDDLAGWYHGRGTDLAALEEREKSVEFLERAVSASRPESDERKEQVKALVETLAVLARGKAGEKEQGARAFCDKMRNRPDLTMVACWLLAQAYMQFPESKCATELCDRGLAIEPDFDDFGADQWIGRLKELKALIPIIESCSQAKAALEGGRPADAVRPLDVAERLAKDAGLLRTNNSIYWLRAQAKLALGNVDEAEKDLKLYQGLLDAESSANDIEAGQRLREAISDGRSSAVLRGLMDQATEAMKAGKFADAVKLLNDAAKKQPGASVVLFLRAQAHVALGNLVDAKRDAKTVAELARTPEDREIAQGLSRMIEEAESSGTIRRSLDQATEAMKGGKFADALRILNEAAKKSPKAGVVLFLRAQAFLALGNIFEAKRDAKAFASLAESADDRRSAAELVSAIEQAESTAGLRRLLEEATSAMQNGRFSEALGYLDQAAAKAPDQSAIYFLRAQARMATSDFMGAIQDALDFQRRAVSLEEKNAAQRLIQMIGQAK